MLAKYNKMYPILLRNIEEYFCHVLAANIVSMYHVQRAVKQERETESEKIRATSARGGNVEFLVRLRGDEGGCCLGQHQLSTIFSTYVELNEGK